MSHKQQVESVVYDGKTIDQSSGTIESIATILAEGESPAKAVDLQRAKKQRESVLWVEIRQHSAAFYFGDASHVNKDTQVAYEPWYREGNYSLLENVYLRAVADSDITGVVIEIGFAEPDTTND